MAYRDGNDAFNALKSTYRRSFDFSGRSRRTDVLFFMIVPALAAMAIILPLTMLFGIRIPRPIDDILRYLLAIPMFALFVRRLHDQNRSGWWILLMVPPVIFSAIRQWDILVDPTIRVIEQGSLAWGNTLLVLIVFALYFWPGTDGTNRYGTDPREGGPAEPAIVTE